MSLNDPAAAAQAAESSVPTQAVEVDVTKLTALSPEVISKQATVSAAVQRVHSPSRSD